MKGTVFVWALALLLSAVFAEQETAVAGGSIGTKELMAIAMFLSGVAVAGANCTKTEEVWVTDSDEEGDEEKATPSKPIIQGEATKKKKKGGSGRKNGGGGGGQMMTAVMVPTSAAPALKSSAPARKGGSRRGGSKGSKGSKGSRGSAGGGRGPTHMPGSSAKKGPPNRARTLFRFSPDAGIAGLALEKGVLVDVLDIKADPEFWKVRTADGKVGMFPSTFLDPMWDNVPSTSGKRGGKGTKRKKGGSKRTGGGGGGGGDARDQVPAVMTEAIKVIEANGLREPALYQQVAHKDEKYARLLSAFGPDGNNAKGAAGFAGDAITAATVLKLWLRNLENPLMENDFFHGFVQGRKKDTLPQQLATYASCFEALREHRAAAKTFFLHLSRVADAAGDHGMTSGKLSLVFGTILLRSKGGGSGPVNEIVGDIIEHPRVVWGVDA